MSVGVYNGAEMLQSAEFESPDCYQRVDFNLLQNGPVTLYFRSAALAADVAWLRQNNYSVKSLDSTAASSEHEMLAMIGRELAFPDYYGNNLDALNDCLSDISVPAAGGLVFQFIGFDHYANRFPKHAHTILDVFVANAWHHLLFGKRLIILLQSNNPRVTFEPVGGFRIRWNPAEFFDSNRIPS